jgi:hypothetical protein
MWTKMLNEEVNAIIRRKHSAVKGANLNPTKEFWDWDLEQRVACTAATEAQPGELCKRTPAEHYLGAIVTAVSEKGINIAPYLLADSHGSRAATKTQAILKSTWPYLYQYGDVCRWIMELFQFKQGTHAYNMYRSKETMCTWHVDRYEKSCHHVTHVFWTWRKGHGAFYPSNKPVNMFTQPLVY